MEIHSIKPLWKEELLASLEYVTEAQQIIAKVNMKPDDDDGYSLQNGELKKSDKFYVGSFTELRWKICNTIHGSTEGGHSGIAATIKKAERIFYWPTLKAYITKVVKECEICQRNKTERAFLARLL